jgi:DNA segregation ATPase FtsK/SpoIIIE, S-DNA-T family
MSQEMLFDRQRAALVRLQKLVKDRALGEQSISSASTAASAEAEKEIQKARRQNAIARKKATDELDASHQTKLAEFSEQYTADVATYAEERVQTRKKTVDQYSKQLEKLRGEHQDKLWTVDSLREAGDKESLDRYQEAKRKATASAKHFEAVWEQANPVLNSVGLSREIVSFDPTRLPSPTPTDPMGKVQKCQEDVDRAADRLVNARLVQFVGIVPTIGMFLLVAILAAPLCLYTLPKPTSIYLTVGWVVIGGLFLRVLIGQLAKRQIRDRGRALGVFQAEAARSVKILEHFAETTYHQNLEEVAKVYARNTDRTNQHYEPRIATTEKQLQDTLAKIEADHEQRVNRRTQERDQAVETELQQYNKAVSFATKKFDTELQAAELLYQDRSTNIKNRHDSEWAKLKHDWHTGLGKVREVLDELSRFGHEHFKPLAEIATGSATLPSSVPMGVQYGTFEVDQAKLADGLPSHPELIPHPLICGMSPAYLPFPDRAAVLIRAWDEGRAYAIGALQNMMLRFLTGLPPSKVRFTVIDPVGLGENFGSFMHLADFDEKLITSRIWTEPSHIEKRLADMTEHMENVIQKYLRNQYKSIEEYNRAAGEVAEPYRVLVIANFPVNFSPEAARRLVSIMSSGPACGVCTLVSLDTRAVVPRDFRIQDLEATAFKLTWTGSGFRPEDPELAPFPLRLETPPTSDIQAQIAKRVGAASKEAAKVEVPFEFIRPKSADVWTGDASKGFEVPIGRAGATRKQIFSIGRGTAQHSLIAGKTGSGKSTLLHALITNLALCYSPEEAELYLIDFKKGVEFQPYAVHRLPHARVIAVESEREFGLSVLQRLDGVLRERGDAFRQAGVNDLAGYREWCQKQGIFTPSPRILLVVDEFQEFFSEEDRLAQEASLLLDRLVRQGRAFGVHILLGSQTLGGSYSLPRSTIDQMAVRIALQCSEADAQLILSKDNTAARLLNRPGEAIYNDANGRLEGNNPFQVVWLDDELRENLLQELQDRSAAKHYPAPLVFEGNSSAEISKNPALAKLIAASHDHIPSGPPAVYLGDPVAIKEPTAAVFRPQSGSSLLMLGQHEEGALALMAASLVSLQARYRPTSEQKLFTVIDGTPDDSEYADYLRNCCYAMGLQNAVVERSGILDALQELSLEMERRQKGEVSDRSPRFLMVHGLHRLRELRKVEDEFGFGRKEKTVSGSERLLNLLREGPPLGIHVLAWCDSLTNLQRAIERQGLRDFALRVLFQMSTTDSSHLLDSPVANRLSRNRALYMEDGWERPEKFRPFGLPSVGWLKQLHREEQPVNQG